MPQSWLQIRCARPWRTPKRQHLSSARDSLMDIRWDREREARTGVPEVVYGPGKTDAHLRQIFSDTSELRIASRLTESQMAVLADLATIHPEARMAVRNPRPL